MGEISLAENGAKAAEGLTLSLNLGEDGEDGEDREAGRRVSNKYAT
jgi:hypothetical protein